MTDENTFDAVTVGDWLCYPKDKEILAPILGPAVTAALDKARDIKGTYIITGITEGRQWGLEDLEGA